MKHLREHQRAHMPCFQDGPRTSLAIACQRWQRERQGSVDHIDHKVATSSLPFCDLIWNINQWRCFASAEQDHNLCACGLPQLHLASLAFLWGWGAAESTDWNCHIFFYAKEHLCQLYIMWVFFQKISPHASYFRRRKSSCLQVCSQQCFAKSGIPLFRSYQLHRINWHEASFFYAKYC